MTEGLGYPLNHAPLGDLTWGIRIETGDASKPYRSPNNEFDGWFWLVPPQKPLPHGYPLDGSGNIQTLRLSVGYVYPNGGDPIETAVPVCLGANFNITTLPRTLDEALFGKWEELAVKTGNKGKLFNIAVPVVPSRFYRTISEKHKYHFLQDNFSQVQIQKGVPPTSYLRGTPQALQFDPQKMSAVAKPQDAFAFDVQRVFDQNLDPSGAPFKDIMAPGTALSNKRPAPEAPHTPEQAKTAPPPSIPEPPAKKPRKVPPKKAAGAPAVKGKAKQTTPTPQIVDQPPVVIQPAPSVPTPTPTPVLVAVLPAIEIVQKEVAIAGPNNKDTVIKLVRKIRADPRFQKVKKNPLEKVPESGNGPSSPHTQKVLMTLAQIADFYLADEWELRDPPKDDFLDSLFGNI